MTDVALPTTPSEGVAGPLRAELDRVWPDPEGALPVAGAALALLAGLAGAALLPEAAPGLGVLVVGVLVALSALPSARGRIGRHEVAYGVLAAMLLTVVVLRDAPWLVSLCLLGTVGVASYALAPARTLLGALLGGLTLAMAGLRGLPWVGRSLRGHLPGAARAWWPVLRATVASVLLVLAFGALFASADPAFASLLPTVDLDLAPARLFVLAAVTGVALSSAFVATAPPAWDRLSPGPGRPVRPVEWMAPIALLDLLFAVFVSVQLTVLFGGHEHVLRTTGLTYAEYARGGFGQLVAVTALTVTVVAAVGRWAPRRTRGQRVALRALLGGLCLLTLVVVASALYRLHLYEEAFGYTRLRLFMNAFETWLGVVVGLVLVAGVRLRAWWLPRAAVATGSAALLLLAGLNPDAFVARHNVERFQADGRLDVTYLSGLSADAVPAVDELPEPLRSCVLRGIHVADDGGLAGWNLGRGRARSLLEARPVQEGATCESSLASLGTTGH